MTRRLRGGDQYIEDTIRALRWIIQDLPHCYERDVLEEASVILQNEMDERAKPATE